MHYACMHVDNYSIKCMHAAFFFGFEQQQYTYNEQADVGLQEIPFSAAPGNETVKRFSFSIHTTSIKGGFIFARMNNYT